MGEKMTLAATDLKFEAWPADPGGMRVYSPRGVKVTHKPTGITVACDHERSQHANRDTAMRALTAAISTAQTVDVGAIREVVFWLTSNSHWISGAYEQGRKLTAALSNAQPEGWRDIASAPKDGTVILVNDTTGEAPWVAAKWLQGEQCSGWIYDDELALDNNPVGPLPTVWLPVPPLPAHPAPDKE